jgi:hypothetical protein
MPKSELELFEADTYQPASSSPGTTGKAEKR